QKVERPADKEVIENINIDRIKPNRYQPRIDFNQAKLNELISSIKEKGVVQPILIRPSDNSYELIAGERRLRACRSLGLTQIPAVIREVDDLNAMEISLIENIQRQELSPIEEALAYQRLIDDFAFTQDKTGQAVGKDRATVANSLRLLTLPKEVQSYISQELLSAGHAKVILSAESQDARIGLAKKVIKKGLSVRALEDLMRKKKATKGKGVALDNDMRMVEEMIQERLGTKVKIVRGKKRGTIQIEYYSDEDLDRILRKLGCV
ncbi:MAG: ParB/RepB/Spo0J family partition protein, partial [Candidatus Omnitrophota bacterium]